MTTKQCTKCGTDKDLSEFSKCRANGDGLRYDCKSCQSARAANWRRNNPDKIRSLNQQYRRDNPDKVRAWAKKWVDDNPDKRKASVKKWEKNNRGNVAARGAKRRATKLKATPEWLTPEQLSEIQQHYWLAKDLQSVTGEVYHVDHIIPLQGENVCGLHVPWNLQVLPADINFSKGNRYEEI